MLNQLIDRMIRAARLEPALYEEVEADQNALPQALLVVVLSSLAAGIGAARIGLLAAIVNVVGALLGWFVWAVLIYLVGTKLLPEPQTRSDPGELLRTLGFAASPGVLRVVGLVPLIGPLLAWAILFWMLAAMVVAVRQALDYESTGRAILVCVIGFAVYVGISIAIALTLGLVIATMASLFG